MSASEGKAVFLSYASQDAEAVKRICDALRAAGVEVWFDQSELVGGDAWDAKIRGQIASCALFVPVISANTQARLEGYFRLEWKLAAQRTHTMAEEKSFLLPVVIDSTRDVDARVPSEFKAVQWTRLASGEATPAFVARVKSLLGGEAGRIGSVVGTAIDGAQGRGQATPLRRKRSPTVMVGAALAVVVAIGVAVMASRKSEGPVAPAPAFSASDEKSVAVLPFANLSGDRDQEYFSDGLTEEILNALARERDLRVPGRTSSFSFKGTKATPAEIARALNVTRLVEGSVQRDGKRVRISFQLTRAADGFTEETGTFTEEVTDIFALQDKVARAVVAKLTRRAATHTVEVLTKNAEAYDAYLRGRDLQTRRGDKAAEAAKFFEQAVALDPAFALAWARLAAARFRPFAAAVNAVDPSPTPVAAMHDAVRHALEAQPNLPEALIMQANLLRFFEGDLPAAQRLLDRTESLQPATAELRDVQALLARDRGNWPEAFRFAREALRLDPEDGVHFNSYAISIFSPGGDYLEADRLYTRSMAIQGPEVVAPFAHRINLRLVWRGPAAALRLVERAPAGQAGVEFYRVKLLLALGRLEEARATFDAMEPAPLAETAGDFASSNAQRLALLMALGREELAQRRAEEVRTNALQEFERGNRGPSVRRNFIQAEITLGHREAAVAALEDWRRQNQRMKNSFHRLNGFPSTASFLYAALGDADAAIALLRQPEARGLDLRYDPNFAPIRSDPRFQELMRQQEAWTKSLPDPIDP